MIQSDEDRDIAPTIRQALSLEAEEGPSYSETVHARLMQQIRANAPNTNTPAPQSPAVPLTLPISGALLVLALLALMAMAYIHR